jgi:hypothetical protein
MARLGWPGMLQIGIRALFGVEWTRLGGWGCYITCHVSYTLRKNRQYHLPIHIHQNNNKAQYIIIIIYNP